MSRIAVTSSKTKSPGNEFQYSATQVRNKPVFTRVDRWSRNDDSDDGTDDDDDVDACNVSL